MVFSRRLFVLLFVVTLLSALFLVFESFDNVNKKDPVRIVEDDPSWECWRMGNGVCGVK